MGEELNNVNIEEENSQIESEEIVEIVEISASEPIAIDSQEAFPALGEDNENLNHAILYGRDTSDQHPITSITGLRKELNVIESLQTIYSDKKQQANYYMWQDENPLQENCEGYFVSICLETDKIEKCNGQTDVFGVTVAEAGFIGNQAYEEANNEDEAIIKIKKDRDNKYGLVVTTGIVGVRCESDVAVGDYVVSNQDGIAKKVNDNCGYLVTAISNDNGMQYAMISLSTPSTWMTSLTDNVQDLGFRMNNAERNITSSINIANSAYAIAKEAKETTTVDIDVIEEKVNEALSKVDDVTGTTANLSNLVNNASKTATQAKAIAESAVNSAEIIRSEAVAKATEALADVNNLISDVGPITSWKDPNSENKGASYFVEHIKNDLATKTEVETAETNSQHALAATSKNAAEIQSLIASIDKYSIGEYSQSYGLTLEQAQSILKPDIMYIPTVDHNESDSIPILGNGVDDISTEKFLKGYAYTWTDEGWSVSKAQSVAFSGEYVAGGTANPYWVVVNQDVVEDGTTYDLGGLYKWENDAWIKVALVLDNSISRAVSSIRQTANEIEAEVVSARGDAASLNLRIQNNETTVQTLASWKDDVSDDISKIATIEQKANDNSASIGLVVAEKNGEKVIDAASIVIAINKSGDSSVDIEANKINLKGAVTTEDIKAGAVTADKIDVDNLFAQDINMTGKFESKATVQVRPTSETLKWIDNIISDPDTYNPDGELTSFYDLNCDGVVDSNDADLMNELRSGDIDFAYLEGAYNYTVPATEVNLEINAHNPNAIVLVWGTDYWGCPFSKQFGIDSLFTNSDRLYLGDDLDWLLNKSSKWATQVAKTNNFEREIVYLKYRFGICTDSSETKIKTVNTYEFDTNNTLTYNLYKGARVAVKFTYSNTASSPQLNVRNSGAKDIRWHGVELPESQYWGAGAIVDFVYNGEQWEIIGVVNANGTTITVDDALSSTSTNPVQNKVVYEELEKKAKFKKYTRTFAKSDWTKLTEEPLYMVQIPKSEHKLENPVVANAMLCYTWTDEDGETQENVQSAIDIGDRILSTGTVKLYVNYDISQYEKYDLKIILQGD